MLPSETLAFLPKVESWASDQSIVGELWLVGSRVRGDFRPDSDLDVVLMTTLGNSDAYNFFFWGQAKRIGDDLSELLGVKVHMLQGDLGLQTKEVATALKLNGVRIFTRALAE